MNTIAYDVCAIVATIALGLTVEGIYRAARASVRLLRRETVMASDIDSMVSGYVECLLWAGVDWDDELAEARPLDENFSVGDMAPEALASVSIPSSSKVEELLPRQGMAAPQ